MTPDEFRAALYFLCGVRSVPQGAIADELAPALAKLRECEAALDEAVRRAGGTEVQPLTWPCTLADEAESRNTFIAMRMAKPVLGVIAAIVLMAASAFAQAPQVVQQSASHADAATRCDSAAGTGTVTLALQDPGPGLSDYSLAPEDLRACRESWGGEPTTVDKWVQDFTYAPPDQRAQWEETIIFRLRPFGITHLRTEKEKALQAAQQSAAANITGADAAVRSAAAAERSAIAAERSAASARTALRIGWFSVVVSLLAIVLTIVLSLR